MRTEGLLTFKLVAIGAALIAVGGFTVLGLILSGDISVRRTRLPERLDEPASKLPPDDSVPS
ncbi:MAG TPA: hypothetical protein VH743_09465 [Beijerinckiaceae bacterium]|jgi:hypothetical protein